MMEAGDCLGVGIIGSGFMGHTYARTVQTMLEGARLAGVAGGSRAPALADEYGVACFESYEDLVARDDVDLVCIATPHACHAEQALAAARAGKHLLIDKPMACTVEDCDAILDACRANGLKCSITFTQRYRVGFATAKGVIASGRLGRVLEIRSYQIVPEGMGVVPPWQVQPENVGILLGHGIHNIDAIRALTGQEVASVFAKCRTLAGAPIEGTSDMLITMADGGVHYVFCSFELPKPGFPRNECGTQIACERGLLDIDPYAETRVSFDGGAWEVAAVQPPIDWAGAGFLDVNRLESYARLIQDLIDAIREDRDPPVTGWDGRQAVAAALAAYESSRTGNEIQLSRNAAVQE